MTDAPVVDVWRLLAASDAGSPVEAIDAFAAELGRTFDAASVSFLVADLSGRALTRLAHATPGAPACGERCADGESASTVPLDGGPVEQALRTQTIQVLAPDDATATAARWQVWAPVTERGDVLGLLEMTLATEPSADTVRAIAQVAHLLSYVVIANRGHTDLFQWGQRSRPFTLSAEIQQRLLPVSRTCEAAAFTLAGWLEPAATIGGDSFDYSLARDVLHLSLTDAMGHGVGAALTATVGVGSLRGSRRVGGTLVEQAHEANAAVWRHALARDDNDFITGQIGRLDLTTGTLEVVNAGHVPPFLVRSGKVSRIELPIDLPLGMFAESTYRSTRITLVPGDRLVFVTDGMLDRHGAQLDLAATLAASRSLHPREAVRAMADEAVEAAGHELPDDATLLCLDWHGHHGDHRSTVAGADPDRASDPTR